MMDPEPSETANGANEPSTEASSPPVTDATGRAPASFWTQARDPKVWGLVVIRAYLALVFAQAAFDHFGVPPGVLAGQWAPHGAFQSIGNAVTANPSLYVHLVIAVELVLAALLVLGLLTRAAGVIGVALNAFFFAAFEWADSSQLYLSWDASFVALWLVVIVSGPGRYLGLAAVIARRWPRWGAWLA